MNTLRLSRWYKIFILVFCLCVALLPLLLFAQNSTPETGSTIGSLLAGAWQWTGGATLNAVFATVGSFAIAVTGMFAIFAGAIFDALLQWTVVGFLANLEYYNIMPAIEIVWTAFRDMANILIIGMFVFIAISIILGLKGFGEKQMIARVLIVAVLINFSLLFTNLIIGSSNFVANVFYKESIAVTGDTAGVGTSITKENVEQKAKNTTGIAGAFLSRMGFASFWNVPVNFVELFKIGFNNNSTPILIFFSLAVSVFLIMIALFFLYGSFLLVSRAILLIFLIITSSLAFASHLIPDQMNKSGYGWSVWWKSLIEAALFGPLLMILLWASLVILQAPAKVAKTASLASFIQNSGDKSGWLAIIMLLFTIGFLYASFKIASSFAGTIGGFNYAAMGPALLGGLGMRLGALIARQTGGRAVAALSSKLGLQAKMAKFRTEDSEYGTGDKGWRAKTKYKMYDFAAQKLKGVAGRDFNMANTMLGKEIAKTASIQQKTIAGENTKGYLGAEERAKEKFARQGERLTFSKEEQEKLRKDVGDAILKTNPELAERQRTSSERKNETEKSLAKAQKAQVDVVERQTKEMETLTEKISSTGQALENAKQRGASADELWEHQNNRDMREVEKASAEVRHQTELDEHTNRIREARQASERAKKINANVLQDIDTQGVREGKLPEKFSSAAENAFGLARDRFSNTLRKVAHVPLTDQNDTIAKGAAEKVKEISSQKRYTRIADILRERGGGGAPPPPPPPPGHP